jgi:hypothetical protein
MNRGHGLTGGGFGRRGGQSVAMPASAARGGPPAADWSHAPAQARISGPRLAGIIVITLLLLICVEAMLSGTSLITPISPLFANIMWYGGFVLGIPLAILVVLNPHKPMGAVKTLLILFLLPFLSAFTADSVAWRIADWIEFPFSTARFEPAAYPIKYASRGRKGRHDSFQIDPFNLKSTTNIAVPTAQYDAIWPNHDDYCITVMQRRSASGAIEILNDGVFTMREPAPAVLTPCRDARGAGR